MMKCSFIVTALFGSVSALRLNSLSKVQNNQINRIVELLQSIEAKTRADGTKDKHVLQENKVSCARILASSQEEQKHEDEARDSAQAQIEDMKGKIGVNSNSIQTAVTDAAHAQEELNSARDARVEEKSEYVKEHETMSKAISEISAAVRIVKSVPKRAEKKALTQIVSTLGVVTRSIGINMDDHKKLQALVQQTGDDDDDDLALVQQQPKEVVYESKAGGIVQTLEDMQEKAEDKLRELQDDETKARQNFEMMAQQLENTIKKFNEQAEDDRAKLAQNKEDKGEAEAALATASNRLKVIVPHYKKINSQCNGLDGAYSRREHERTMTLDGIKTAVNALTNDKFVAAEAGASDAYGGDSFLQISSKKIDDATRARAARIIESAAHRLHSVGLEQIASRVTNKGGAFDKVKGMIEEMISRLEKQSSEEQSHKQYCDKELATNKAKLDKKESKANKHQAREEKATAQIAEAETALKDAAKAQATAQKEDAEATAVREEEGALFNAFESDSKDALEGLEVAINALAAVFPDTEKSLIQQPDASMGGLASFESGSYGDSAQGPVQMLQVIRSDMEKELTDRTQDNNLAKKEYQEKKNALEIEIAAQKASQTQLSKALAQYKKQKQDYSSDLDNVREEIAALTESQTALNKQCGPNVETYQDRATKRNEEIKSLKEALEVLELDTTQ